MSAMVSPVEFTDGVRATEGLGRARGRNRLLLCGHVVASDPVGCGVRRASYNPWAYREDDALRSSTTAAKSHPITIKGWGIVGGAPWWYSSARARAGDVSCRKVACRKRQPVNADAAIASHRRASTHISRV